MKKILFSALVVTCFNLSAQDVSVKLQEAFSRFEADSQLRHALVSLYVINAKTGAVVFEKNAQVGMAPASTQKIITSVTAFELLGRNFRYHTRIGLHRSGNNNVIQVYPSGDPTLGSWRWDHTKEDLVIQRLVGAIARTGVKKIDRFQVEGADSQYESIPDGWIWQDIGNYYGAGAGRLNWRENQFDIILRSGKEINSKVDIVKTIPPMYDLPLKSLVVSAAKGTGDNAYVYYPLTGKDGIVRGTIPVDENSFAISAAMPVPSNQLFRTLFDSLRRKGIQYPNLYAASISYGSGNAKDSAIIHTEISPALDSIIYFFNKRSINLYGEALLRTMGEQETGKSMTDSGLVVLKKFWREHGITSHELNMHDGSGLSPLNRVTTHAQVEILKYARSREWYPAFYDALPEFNGMKIKSGTISDVKGFCGYHTSREGTEYIFSFLVNNYNGRASQLVNKMYRVLDCLK